MKMVIRESVLIVLSLFIFCRAQATPPTCPPIDSTVMAQVKKLHYSNSPHDRYDLTLLVKLLRTNVTYCCTSEDLIVFEEAFCSYPRELLLKNILLDSAQQYRPLPLFFSIDLIETNHLYEVIPYLTRYLDQHDLSDDLEMWRRYMNLLGNSGREEAKTFLRKQLTKLEQFDRTRRGLILESLGRLRDDRAYPSILEYCKKVILSDVKDDYYSSPCQECARTATYYRNPEFFGFVINHLNGENLLLISHYVFPPFALDRSIYFMYTDATTSYSISPERLFTTWKDWYNNNHDNIVWSDSLNKFIERRTETRIKEYLGKK